MGQIHAALVTDAKCKSGLLRKQLTQINNYQTEGLLHEFVCLAPVMLDKCCKKYSFFPRWRRNDCNLGWPLPCAAPALSLALKLSTAGTSMCPLPSAGGCGHSQNCGLGDISFLGRSWELEGIHCASGTLQTAEWTWLKVGPLGKICLIPESFLEI